MLNQTVYIRRQLITVRSSYLKSDILTLENSGYYT